MSQIWKDKQYGENGIWLYLINIFLLSLPFVAYFMFSPYAHLHTSEDNIFKIYFFGTIFSYLEIRNLLIFWEGKTIIQSITIDDGNITGIFYYGREIKFNILEIKSINYYPLTWRTKWSNFLDAKSNIPGIDIILERGEQFRISPKLERFSELVATLKENIRDATK